MDRFVPGFVVLYLCFLFVCSIYLFWQITRAVGKGIHASKSIRREKKLNERQILMKISCDTGGSIGVKKPDENIGKFRSGIGKFPDQTSKIQDTMTRESDMFNA